LLRLLRTVLMQTDLPLHGEPLEGLQIMGVLETRLLDFDSVLVLSASEGNLPRTGGDNSFIPNELREAFSLTTVRRRTAVFAYYFYRLIQRARSVRLMYSAVTDGITRGEMSRFISQLLVESRIPISQYKMQLKPGISGGAGAADIAKPENLASLVERLSPSSIINYMKCPQMFYFKHVAKIPEPQPPVQEVAPNVFGSVFHNAAELFYKDQGGRRLTPDMLKRAAKDTAKLREYVEQAYISVRREAEPEADEQVCRSENAVMKSAAVKCLAKMLLYDATYQSVKVVAEEEKWELTVDVALPDGTQIPVLIKGFIDRVDEVEDVSDGSCRTLLRVVDYKTGGAAKALPDVPAMFCCDGKHEHYAFQVSLYAMAYRRMHGKQAAPAIYYLNSLNKGNTPYLQMGSGKNAAPVYSYTDYADEFEPALQSLLSSIFDPSKPFTVTEEPEKVCKYCPYGRLCGM
ncbi:MAG: PD-(D/E)XK nuclease family protein, partial [Alloprevotella sp.]|nr:PD-(D/E)XK nuclease family protein [Alloprevotella sp.]